MKPIKMSTTQITKLEWFAIWVSVLIFLGVGILTMGSLYIYIFV